MPTNDDDMLEPPKTPSWSPNENVPMSSLFRMPRHWVTQPPKSPSVPDVFFSQMMKVRKRATTVASKEALQSTSKRARKAENSSSHVAAEKDQNRRITSYFSSQG
jgi:hypothetical protein